MEDVYKRQGEEGILTKAKESRINTELSAYQEELETYEIPSSVVEGVEVKEIADYAFHGQIKMKNIVIPSTMQKIGGSFNYCLVLTKIEIPNSVTRCV